MSIRLSYYSIFMSNRYPLIGALGAKLDDYASRTDLKTNFPAFQNVVRYIFLQTNQYHPAFHFQSGERFNELVCSPPP